VFVVYLLYFCLFLLITSYDILFSFISFYNLRYNLSRKLSMWSWRNSKFFPPTLRFCSWAIKCQHLDKIDLFSICNLVIRILMIFFYAVLLPSPEMTLPREESKCWFLSTYLIINLNIIVNWPLCKEAWMFQCSAPLPHITNTTTTWPPNTVIFSV